MFADGVTDDGSSSVPTRTTVSPGRPVESANRCDPQAGQKRRVTLLPLSPWLAWAATGPLTSRSWAGKIALTVPFPAMCWQSRHQQIRDTTGSDLRRYLTLPQRQPPVRSDMSFVSGNADGPGDGM